KTHAASKTHTKKPWHNNHPHTRHEGSHQTNKKTGINHYKNTLLSSQTTNAHQHKTPTQGTPHQGNDLLFSCGRLSVCWARPTMSMHRPRGSSHRASPV